MRLIILARLFPSCKANTGKSCAISINVLYFPYTMPRGLRNHAGHERMNPMKHGNIVLKLVFGGIGLVYTIVGLISLLQGIDAAGSLDAIFTLQGELRETATVGAIFSVLGPCFLLAAVILIIRDKRRAELREDLLAWGSRVTGTVTQVRVNYNIRVNRRNPVIAQVLCPFPSGEVTLTSPHLWKIRPAVGDTVEVLFDPMDERKYVIDFQEK